ncbi:hypothetical protein KKC1_10510 [Calderihabitans maritimus]|uniref:Uncharacterized protein n=1 Tax=Calderihabitans maritimus TaxID=1246530 RepID=A0A1Z5HRJ4_9FIRM|nr:hypothetical protein KKC1_10510 [Calderihabitans maritimus]
MRREKEKALQAADRFIGELTQLIDPDRTLLILLSACPSDHDYRRKNFMTPVVMAGPGYGPGLLSSGTTRRPGIITLTDIAPTVLKFFDLQVSPVMSGRPVYTVEASNPWQTLRELNRKLVFIYVARPYLVKGYVLLQIIVLFSFVVALFRRHRLIALLQPVLLALMAVPLSLLIMGAFYRGSLPLYALEAIVLTVFVTLAAIKFTRQSELDPFLLISLTTALAVAADLVTGARLMQNSVLGYDAVAGARYYGIGNEYMGVLLGASITGAAGLLERLPAWRSRLLPLLGGAFAVIIFLMAAPQIGANAGGTVAAVSAFSFTVLRLAGMKISYREVVTIAAGISIILAGFTMFDLGRGVQVQSHWGRAAALIQEEGVMEAADIITRKLANNLRLVRYTAWSRVLLVMLLTLTILIYRPVGLLKRITRRYPAMAQGFMGVMVGSGVALLVNDSGIVAAATMMIYAVIPLTYLVIEEKKRPLLYKILSTAK